MIELILSITVLAFLLTLLSSPKIGDRDLSDDSRGLKIIGGLLTAKGLKKAGIIGGIGLAGAGAYSAYRDYMMTRGTDWGDGFDWGGTGDGETGEIMGMILEILPMLIIVFVAIFGLMMIIQALGD